MHKFIFYFLLLIAFSVSATQQINDTYIFEGKEYEIEVMPYGKSPLESLYSFEEILGKLKLDGGCSANWRGYKGTWEVKGKELYLNSLVKGACAENPPLVESLNFFGEESYPLKAKWFNGQVNIRLTPNKYLYCGNDEKAENTIGYEYKATVYEFSGGDLIFKSEQVIKKIWNRTLTSC